MSKGMRSAVRRGVSILAKGDNLEANQRRRRRDLNQRTGGSAGLLLGLLARLPQRGDQGGQS